MPSDVTNSILVVILTGYIVGYNTAIIGGISKPLINHTFLPDASKSDQNFWSGLLTTSILVGACGGSLLGGKIADKLGRKGALLMLGIIDVIFTVLLGISNSLMLVMIFRTLLGISVGMSTVCGPLYLAELVPPERAGQLGVIFQLAVCGTILIAQVVNLVFGRDREVLSNWRWQLQFALGALPGLMLVLLALFSLRESPKWRKKTTTTQPKTSTSSTIISEAAGDTTHEALIQSDSSLNSPPMVHVNKWKLLFTSEIRCVFTGIILAAANQLTGINAVIYYAPSIFEDIGVSDPLVITACVVGVWNLVTVYIPYQLVDRLGRRRLLIYAIFIMIIGHFGMGIAYKMSDPAILSITGVMIVVAAFESGPGPLFFIMATEASSPNVKQEALAFTNLMAWFFNVCVTLCFPIVNGWLGENSGNVFFLFAVLSLCIFTLVTAFIHPVTGKHPAEDGRVPIMKHEHKNSDEDDEVAALV